MSEAVFNTLCVAGGAVLMKLIDILAGRGPSQAKLILDLQERVDKLLEEKEACLDTKGDRGA